MRGGWFGRGARIAGAARGSVIEGERDSFHLSSPIRQWRESRDTVSLLAWSPACRSRHTCQSPFSRLGDPGVNSHLARGKQLVWNDTHGRAIRRTPQSGRGLVICAAAFHPDPALSGA